MRQSQDDLTSLSLTRSSAESFLSFDQVTRKALVNSSIIHGINLEEGQIDKITEQYLHLGW